LAELCGQATAFVLGFRTRSAPHMLVGGTGQQALAGGFPVGKRFRSAPVVRVADGNPVHLGHHARADGRWRVYAFADDAPDSSRRDRHADRLGAWARWLGSAPDSPLVRYTPEGADPDAVIEVKVIYRRPHPQIELADVPGVFLPRVGPFGLIDHEKVYAADPADDIFAARGISPDGAVVVV